SFAFRSSMTWLVSTVSASFAFSSILLYALLKACINKVIEVAIQNGLRITSFYVGPQILDARLIEHVRTDLMAPADVSLGIFHGLLFFVALAHLQLVQAGFEHSHGFRAIAVLRSVALALHDNIRWQMSDADRRVCLVDVLAAGTACTKRIDAQVRRIDGNFDRIVDFRVN